MDGGDRIRLAKSQLIELAYLVPPCPRLGLVDHDKDRRPERTVFQFLLRAAQDICHFEIRRSDSGLSIVHKEDNICFVDGSLGLLANLIDEIGRADRERSLTAMRRVDAAGVHDVERTPVPLRLPEQA